MPPTWTVFFYVENVDTTAVTVQAAAGSILEPAFDLPDVHISVVADPTGGTFGIISGPLPVGTYLDQGPAPSPGSNSSHAIRRRPSRSMPRCSAGRPRPTYTAERPTRRSRSTTTRLPA